MKRVLLLILLIMFLGGCSNVNNTELKTYNDENSESNSNVLENQNDNNLNNMNLDNYCLDLDNELWKNQCLAYKTINSSYCEAFEFENVDDSEIDRCYFELSVNSNSNDCINIKDKNLRWKCEAVVNKNISLCEYSLSIENEIKCSQEYIKLTGEIEKCNFVDDKQKHFFKDVEKYDYKKYSKINGNLVEYNGTGNYEIYDKKLNRIYINNLSCKDSYDSWVNGMELIKSTESFCEKHDCNLYDSNDCNLENETWHKLNCFKLSALKSQDYKKCFLIKDESKRDNCLFTIARDLKDINICKEISNDKNSCINYIARKSDVSQCMDNDCITYSVMDMKYGIQKINKDVCEQIRGTGRNYCLVEYAKSEFYLDNSFLYN